MTGRCKRSERWSLGSGGKLKVLKLEFVFVLPFRDNSSFGLNSLGPLCLWQCFTLWPDFGAIWGFSVKIAFWHFSSFGADKNSEPIKRLRGRKSGQFYILNEITLLTRWVKVLKTCELVSSNVELEPTRSVIMWSNQWSEARGKKWIFVLFHQSRGRSRINICVLIYQYFC